MIALIAVYVIIGLWCAGYSFFRSDLAEQAHKKDHDVPDGFGWFVVGVLSLFLWPIVWGITLPYSLYMNEHEKRLAAEEEEKRVDRYLKKEGL